MLQLAMSRVLDDILLLIVLVILGVPVSLIALIPPIRKRCQLYRVTRIVTICILGVLSFAAIFPLVTRMYAGWEVFLFAFGTHHTLDPDYYPDYIAELYDNEQRMKEAAKEVWTRRLIPPVFRQDCYSSDGEICNLADNTQKLPSNFQEWSTYLKDIATASVSAVASCILARFITRQRRTSSGLKN